MLAPAPETISKYMRWAIGLFLLYALFHTAFGTKIPATHPQTGTKESSANCDGNNPTLASTFQAFAFPLIPSYAPSVHITDTKQGTGAPLMCGQHATLRYEYEVQNGPIIFSSLDSKAPESVRIGSGELLPGLERGALGMQAGGERTIVMPSALGFGGNTDIAHLRDHAQFKLPANPGSDIISAKASLVSFSPPFPVSAMPIRIINGLFGGGEPMQCGDKVYADINIWKLDGTSLFTTTGKEPLTFTIGESQMPVGIEEGVIGMHVGGQRRLILPPVFNKPLDNLAAKPSLLTGVNFPDEIVLVEIMLHPVPVTPSNNQPVTLVPATTTSNTTIPH